MTQHTPGPWVATGFEGIVVNDSLGRTLALAPGLSTNIPEMSANARLIAAAPDLLAALQGLAWAVSGIEYVETEYAEQVAQARAAIAKAQGEV